MTAERAGILAGVLAGYLGVGFVFALGFAARWAQRLDPAAQNGTLGFRVLLVPGAALLWPVLAIKLLRARGGR